METLKKHEEDKVDTSYSFQSENSEQKIKKLESPFNIQNFLISKEDSNSKKNREEKELEEEIKDIAKYIKTKLTYVTDIFNIRFPYTMDPKRLLLYILSKNSRNHDDNIVLRQFLTLYPDFIDTLKLKEEISDPKDLLLKISTHLKKERFHQDKVVFYNGQLGKTFYLILEGEVSVIIPVEYKVNITDRELFNYMNFLLKNKDYELIRLILESNDIILNEVDYKDNDQFMKFKSVAEKVLPVNIETERIDRYSYVKRYNFFKEKSKTTIKNSINEFKLNNHIDINDSYNENKKKKPKHNKEKYRSKLNNKLIIGENSKEKTSEKELNKNENINDKFLNNNDIKDNNFYYGREQTFNVWKYYEICRLTKGKCFGELALQKDGKKRNATIITNTDCIFGTLQKEVYQMFVRETMDRARKINVELLLRSKLFKGYPPEKFETHYFKCFKFMKKNKCDYLFWQNTERKYIYFIKKGEVEIELVGSCIKIDEILKNLGKSENSRDLKELVKSHKKLSNFCNTNKKFNVLIFSGGDAIGLNDHLISEKENLFAFNAFCATDCEIFAIDEKLFDIMLEEKVIKNNYNRMIKDRKERLIERLTKLKINSIYQYYNLVKNNKDLDDEDFKELFENGIIINSKKKEMRKIFIKNFAEEFKINLNNEDNVNLFNKNNNNLYTESNFNSCKNNISIRKKSKTKSKTEIKIYSKNSIKSQTNNNTKNINDNEIEKKNNKNPIFSKSYDKKQTKKLIINSMKPITDNDNIDNTMSNKETQTINNFVSSKSSVNMEISNSKLQNKGNSSRVSIDSNFNIKINGTKVEKSSKSNLNSFLSDKKLLNIGYNFKNDARKFGNNISQAQKNLFLSDNTLPKFFIKQALLSNTFIDNLLLINYDSLAHSNKIIKKKKQNNKNQNCILKTEPHELNNKFRKRNVTINAVSEKKYDEKLKKLDRYINYMEEKRIKNKEFILNSAKSNIKTNEKILRCSNRTLTKFLK